MTGSVHQQIQHLEQFYWQVKKQPLQISHPHQTTNMGRIQMSNYKFTVEINGE